MNNFLRVTLFILCMAATIESVLWYEDGLAFTENTKGGNKHF